MSGNIIESQPIALFSYPRAIVHIDCDAFFASCEEVVHPALKGKPIVTGGEREIVVCPSYEAKSRGVQRGMRVIEARKIFRNINAKILGVILNGVKENDLKYGYHSYYYSSYFKNR